MALATYFDRAAMAASQLLAGQDVAMLRNKLQEVVVGVSFSGETATSNEGIALLDLLVRILARLYPRLCLSARAGGDKVLADLASLAININPNLEIVEGARTTVCVSVGATGGTESETTVFCGSEEWTALISSTSSQPVGRSLNPFGPGAAACIAAANVFRFLFLSPGEWFPDCSLAFNTCTDPSAGGKSLPLPEVEIGDVVLTGVGAIGMSSVWALCHAPVTGNLYLVDPEEIELSNLQRYVLPDIRDVGRDKVLVATDFLTGKLRRIPSKKAWDQFVVEKGYRWPRVLVAVDNASDRRAVQTSLPGWIGNAWTQPGDLGVSLHRFEVGACLNCLYLPDHATPSEDAIIAEALRIPEHVTQIRKLLNFNEPAPRDLLEIIGTRFAAPLDVVLQFEQAPLRTLYVKGICGGMILPVDGATANRDMHVPLAHQSALAGILLAASLLAETQGYGSKQTTITRVNVMRPVGTNLTQPAAKDPRNICICQDKDYISAYSVKYNSKQAGNSN